MKDVCPSPQDQGSLASSAHLSSHAPEAPHSTVSYVAVMPEQFFDLPPCCDRGEAALMYAVLEDALNCFAKQFVENGFRARYLAREAERWFFCDEDYWPFSFANVCLALRVDPGYVRARLRQWRQRPPPRQSGRGGTSCVALTLSHRGSMRVARSSLLLMKV
jgi:hypothetical protein